MEQRLKPAVILPVVQVQTQRRESHLLSPLSHLLPLPAVATQRRSAGKPATTGKKHARVLADSDLEDSSSDEESGSGSAAAAKGGGRSSKRQATAERRAKLAQVGGPCCARCPSCCACAPSSRLLHLHQPLCQLLVRDTAATALHQNLPRCCRW